MAGGQRQTQEFRAIGLGTCPGVPQKFSRSGAAWRRYEHETRGQAEDIRKEFERWLWNIWTTTGLSVEGAWLQEGVEVHTVTTWDRTMQTYTGTWKPEVR